MKEFSKPYCMPKLFKDSGFIFRFFAADLNEPIHVHIEKDGYIAKFWVNPLNLRLQ